MSDRNHDRAPENTSITISCSKEMKARLRLIAGRKGIGSLSGQMVAILEPQLPILCQSLGITEKEVEALVERL